MNFEDIQDSLDEATEDYCWNVEDKVIKDLHKTDRVNKKRKNNIKKVNIKVEE